MTIKNVKIYRVCIYGVYYCCNHSITDTSPRGHHAYGKCCTNVFLEEQKSTLHSSVFYEISLTYIMACMSVFKMWH